jgi:hypothetical protein
MPPVQASPSARQHFPVELQAPAQQAAPVTRQEPAPSAMQPHWPEVPPPPQV